jgi:hypothetical protein
VTGEPSRGRARPIRMHRILGILGAAALLVAGCGSSSSSVATDPASDPAGNPSFHPGPIRDAAVQLISLSAAGGVARAVATPLATEADVDRFVAQFRMPAMQDRIRRAAGLQDGARPPDRFLLAQVVAVGCDRPPGVDVRAGGDGQVQIVPHDVASPLEECLVPVTTVAVATLPVS